jgi:hypothetical protein
MAASRYLPRVHATNEIAELIVFTKRDELIVVSDLVHDIEYHEKCGRLIVQLGPAVCDLVQDTLPFRR